jgi:hypothetical protein
MLHLSWRNRQRHGVLDLLRAQVLFRLHLAMGRKMQHLPSLQAALPRDHQENGTRCFLLLFLFLFFGAKPLPSFSPNQQTVAEAGGRRKKPRTERVRVRRKDYNPWSDEEDDEDSESFGEDEDVSWPSSTPPPFPLRPRVLRVIPSAALLSRWRRLPLGLVSGGAPPGWASSPSSSPPQPSLVSLLRSATAPPPPPPRSRADGR